MSSDVPTASPDPGPGGPASPEQADAAPASGTSAGAAQPTAPMPEPDDPEAIRSLPPLDEWASDLPISTATGQPRRGKVMVVGMSLLYASALTSAASLALAWWNTIHVVTWPDSIRLFRMAHVAPNSWQTVLLVLAMGLIGASMVATTAIAGFNAWNGHRWSRILAIVSVGVTCLAWFLNPMAWAAVPLAAVGAAVLWTRPVTRYFGHWEAFRRGEPQRPIEWTAVYYGPLPRYR